MWFIIIFLMLVNAYLVYKIYDYKGLITGYRAMMSETTRLVQFWSRQAEELERRDQVKNYNALEQGTNELVENYESDRLDLVQKIKDLEMERDFLVATSADAVRDLTEMLETFKRAQALHVEAILEYQREQREKIEIPKLRES